MTRVPSRAAKAAQIAIVLALNASSVAFRSSAAPVKGRQLSTVAIAAFILYGNQRRTLTRLLQLH